MLYLNEIKLHYPGVYVAILHLLKIEMVYNTHIYCLPCERGSENCLGKSPGTQDVAVFDILILAEILCPYNIHIIVSIANRCKKNQMNHV